MQDEWKQEVGSNDGESSMCHVRSAKSFAIRSLFAVSVIACFSPHNRGLEKLASATAANPVGCLNYSIGFGYVI